MVTWRRNIFKILQDRQVKESLLFCIQKYDPNPYSWVIIEAFKSFFNPKNTNNQGNYFEFPNGATLTISRRGIAFQNPNNPEDAEYLTWYVAQRVGKEKWLCTFLTPFPED